MALSEYRKKRSGKTPEPKKSTAPKKGPLHFVVQKHDASHLHYDFRLELDGVLKSWAVPKGPSLNPADKRLAMETEDHPYEYKDFEGTIPEGAYGAGDVIVWDEGLYASTKTADPDASRKEIAHGYAKGDISFVLYGQKLKGAFTLVKIKDQKERGNAWLLIKSKDEYASRKDITRETASVKTGAALARDEKRPRTNARKRGKDTPPTRIRPMLATSVDKPFDRPGWYFETKWDGYRAIAEIVRGKVRLYSRHQIDFTQKYSPITDALASIPHDCVIDGEIIALKGGRPDFHALQNYEDRHAPLQYAVFDLLYLDGEDLRGKPLRERKELLRSIVPKDERILFSEHVENKGLRFFSFMREKGLEGMVAKDAESLYREDVRGDAWLKVKLMHEQEAIIIGFTKPRGSRKHLGALVLGAYENGTLVYIGHSGGGFTERELADLHAKLAKIVRKESPVTQKVPVNSPITWVKPTYVCQIKFTEWTPEGYMRHPIYAGMRVDKKPREVVRELPKSASSQEPQREAPALTNLDKVFWPEEGYTKGDVVRYYERMADTILPYLKDRPENLHRHPNGWKEKSFYQKDIAGEVPPFGESVKIWSESNRKEIEYLVCNNKETLLYMANLGCIEINPWNSRVGNLERPDYMIFDIDPHGRPFEDVIRVAQEIRRVLDLACEQHFPKTSGKTGLHILVPLGGRYRYEDVRNFAKLVSTLVHRALPDLTSMERSPKDRGGKMYLDYLQNRSGQTIAAPYSLRPAPGATVSTPLAWSEVRKGLDPKKFTIKTIWKRLEKKGDLFEDMLGPGVDLADAIRCLQEKLTHPQDV